jgi:uncharacterized protein YjbI with pentapeptide repeats
MNDAQNAKRIEIARASADDSAKHVSSLYVTFLLAAIYVAIALGSTTDEQLLRAANLPLPFLGVGLPVKAFYVVVPFAFLLLHLHLLLHIYFLSRKTIDYEEAVRHVGENSPPDAARRLLFPLVINTVTVRAYPSSLIRCLLRAVVSVTVITGPVLLLLCLQARFLPYHSRPITMWHRVCVVLDLALIWLMWLQIQSGTSTPRVGLSRYHNIARLIAATAATACAFVTGLFIAVVPAEPLDLRLHIFDSLTSRLHRNLILTDKTLVAEPPSSELIAAYIQQGRAEKEAWRDYAKGIVLRERDLRGADFSYSRLYNADFRGADLNSANLQQAKLLGALFSPRLEVPHAAWEPHTSSKKIPPAKLNGANLSGADLYGANFTFCELEGADLTSANLIGSELALARLRGADLRLARLECANLLSAELQGAQLRGAHLEGAYLGHANLEAVDLRGAELQGARLEDATFDLCDFRGARVGALTNSDIEALEAQLQGNVDDPTLARILARMPPAGMQTAFAVHPRSKFRYTFWDNDIANALKIYVDSPVEQQYDTMVAAVLVEMACNDEWILKAEASRITRLVMPPEPLAVELARRLIQAVHNSKCPTFGTLPSEVRGYLEAEADRSPSPAEQPPSPPR